MRVLQHTKITILNISSRLAVAHKPLKGAFINSVLAETPPPFLWAWLFHPVATPTR